MRFHASAKTKPEYCYTRPGRVVVVVVVVATYRKNKGAERPGKEREDFRWRETWYIFSAATSLDDNLYVEIMIAATRADPWNKASAPKSFLSHVPE